MKLSENSRECLMVLLFIVFPVEIALLILNMVV